MSQVVHSKGSRTIRVDSSLSPLCCPNSSPTSRNVAIGPKVEAIEVHYLLCCADSRSETKHTSAAIDTLSREFRRKGIAVVVFRENIAGVHITDEVLQSVKKGITQQLKHHKKLLDKDVPIDLFVHVISHGEAKLVKPTQPAKSLHDLEMASKSPCNCGMRGAYLVMRQLQEELIRAKVTLNVSAPQNGRSQQSIEIKNEEDIRKVVKMTYGVGSLLTSLVEHIADEAIHAVRQKEKLLETLGSINEWNNQRMRIHVTAAVHDLKNHKLHALDGREREGDFVTRLFHAERKIITKNGVERTAASKQHPTVAVIHPSGIYDARQSAARLSKKPFKAGLVFAVGGNMLDNLKCPLDWNKIVAIYMAMEKWGLKNWIVLGETKEQAEKILLKLRQDPFVDYFMRHKGLAFTAHAATESAA